MELKFQSAVCPYLRKVVSQVQTQEQTQELRLPDGMPDIGRVLGCWGLPLIRSKEWRADGMSVSGGVMVWVLYVPEDGTEPRTVDTWLPFQMKWDFPETKRDGTICTSVRLKSADARSTSARKLMTRAGISILGEAYEAVDTQVFLPETTEEDVQLLRRTYPMMLPKEAGEKSFQLDEELTLPEDTPKVWKILRYLLEPQISEQKVMAGKLVFRGNCRMELLYAQEGGELHRWETEIPFSQYADLDSDYTGRAEGVVIPLMTGAELDRDEEGRLHLKCGITGQYRIFDRIMVEVVEDAYSPNRKVEALMQELQLPVRLDSRREQIPFRQETRVGGQKCVDTCLFWDLPDCRQKGDSVEIRLPGQYQILYVDEEGRLQSTAGHLEETREIPSQMGNEMFAVGWMPTSPRCTIGEDTMEISADITLDITADREESVPMVTALQLGEAEEPDPARPTVIVRRAGENRLWDLAKECGSTVDAIREANHLQQEPDNDQLLLIPVL